MTNKQQIWQCMLLAVCLLILWRPMLSMATPDNVSPEDFPKGKETMLMRRVDGDTQIINKQNGKLLIQHVLRAYSAGDFIVVSTGDEDTATLSTANKGLLSTDGRLVLKPIYDDIHIGNNSSALAVKDGDQYALFSIEGEQLTPFKYDDFDVTGSSADFWIAERDGKQGVIDPQSGATIVPLTFKDIDIWRGFIIAGTGYRTKPERRTTVFDGHGKTIAGLKDVKNVDIWHNAGLIVAGTRVVDPASGKTIVETGRYDSIKPFDTYDIHDRDKSLDNYNKTKPLKAIAIVSKNGKYGAIGADGQVRVPVKYKRVTGLRREKANYLRVIADTPQADHNVGVIDTHDKQIVAAKWDGIDLREAAEWSGDPSQWYFFVRRDHRFGSLALDGSTIMPAEFDIARRMARGGELYRVERDGKSGVCNLVSGECPINVEYDKISLFDDSTAHAEIFAAVKNGEQSLISENGHALVASADSIRKVETGPSDTGVKLVVTDGEGVRGATLNYDDDTKRWQQSGSDIDLVKLLDTGDYDGHGVAQLTQPTIIERYLPEQYANAKAVLAGVNHGKLRELSYPSLQLSADHKAYVFFSEFTDVTARISNTLPVCATGDGFDILLHSAENDTQQCTDSGEARALHFARSDDGQSVHCDNCKAMGIPSDWVLRNKTVETPDQCSVDKKWSQERAKKRYADWLSRWEKDIGDLTRAFDSSDGKPSVARVKKLIGASVDMHSRAPYNIVQSIVAARQSGSPDVPTIIELNKAFANAEPAGYGGIYPETSDQFAGKCQQIWYLRLPKLERAVANDENQPAGLSYTLPDTGDFKRHAYPFVLFTSRDGTLRFAGLATEFADALKWQPDGSTKSASPDTP